MSEDAGPWRCDKCGQTITAAGSRCGSSRGNGAYVGPCPWGCGSWITRGLRWMRPGKNMAFRDGERDRRVVGND